MKYYKLIYDFENDDDYIGCTASDTLNLNQYIVCEGNKIEVWNDEISFDFNPDEGKVGTDYLGNSYGWLIFSDNLINKISHLVNDSIQYLAIIITNKKNNTNLLGYHVANVCKVIDALDLGNSKYDLFELDDEKILSVEKYALKKEAIKNYNIFKLENDTIPTFVSEEFKNKIEEDNLTGFQFLEVKVV
jgi:hypothetical protein